MSSICEYVAEQTKVMLGVDMAIELAFADHKDVFKDATPMSLMMYKDTVKEAVLNCVVWETSRTDNIKINLLIFILYMSYYKICITSIKIEIIKIYNTHYYWLFRVSHQNNSSKHHGVHFSAHEGTHGKVRRWCHHELLRGGRYHASDLRERPEQNHEPRRHQHDDRQGFPRTRVARERL